MNLFKPFKLSKSQTLNSPGFSILEMLVVLGIIMLLAAVAVPNYFRYKRAADITAIHYTAIAAIKDFNICMAETTADHTECRLSVVDRLSGTKISSVSSIDISTISNEYGFTADVEDDFYTKVCIHLDDEGNIGSLSYGGTGKLCYKSSIPSAPPIICEGNSDCATGFTCSTKTATYSATGCN